MNITGDITLVSTHEAKTDIGGNKMNVLLKVKRDSK
jgi:hypothetical protein